MHRYALSANYLQCKVNDKSKRLIVYIDGRPKETGNIAGFINSMHLGSTNKRPNFIFEVREGNHVFVCAIKSISLGEELLIDYNLNHIDTKKNYYHGTCKYYICNFYIEGLPALEKGWEQHPCLFHLMAQPGRSMIKNIYKNISIIKGIVHLAKKIIIKMVYCTLEF